MCSGHFLSEVDAHAGQRVWSVAHSSLRQHLVASTSDDRTARLWAGPGLATAAAVVELPGGAIVCGADFSPIDLNLLALAASDRCAYIFDLRRLATPLLRLVGHSRPVSYARFMGDGGAVTASTDGTLAVWDLRGGAAAAHGADGGSCCTGGPVRVFRGHCNEKNFVGLSVRGGLVACGSETPEVFSYYTSWDEPLARRGLAARPPATAACELKADCATSQPFVSSVCWQPADAGAALALPPLLACAASDGHIDILALTKPLAADGLLGRDGPLEGG